MQIKLNQFGDKEMITDALTSQKMITSTYNTFANECATRRCAAVYEHSQRRASNSARDFYRDAKARLVSGRAAEKTKIDQAKQKFAKGSSSQ